MCLKPKLTGGCMNSETLIKLLPFIGIAIGLFIGEQSRDSFIMADVPWGDLIDGYFNRSGTDQRLAEKELIHLGTYGLVGGVLGFLCSVALKNQNAKVAK